MWNKFAMSFFAVIETESEFRNSIWKPEKLIDQVSPSLLHNDRIVIETFVKPEHSVE